MTLEFMGNQFDGPESLRKEYPAFCGEDAIRAIKHGCKTVMEVEKFCFAFRNGTLQKYRLAAQRNSFVISLNGGKGRKGKKKRKTA